MNLSKEQIIELVEKTGIKKCIDDCYLDKGEWRVFAEKLCEAAYLLGIQQVVAPIDTAPRDGSEIIGIYKDGTEELIRWNDERYCMLGRRAGSYPPGWSSAEPNVDKNLPLDDDEIVGWKP